jgi:PAS domain S-box-containing protein
VEADLDIVDARDIDEPKGARESLPGNEGQYRDIFRASREALVVADARTGMLLDANPAAIALLGRSLDEIRTLHQSDLHTGEDHVAGLEAFENRRHIPGATEHVILRGDGARVWVEISASPMRGPHGEELVLGIFHDLTERNRASEALRLSEARLRAITDSAHDAIVMMNPRGEISYWNPAAESILGYSGEQAMGKDLHQLIAPERYHPEVRKSLPGCLYTGRGNAVGSTIELWARRMDGVEIAIDLSLSAVNLNGELHAVGIIRDITMRKLEAEALQHSEEMFRQLAENIREVFWMAPTDSHEVIYVSPAFEQVWGRSCKSLYENPSSWMETILPEDLEKTRILVAPQEPVEAEFRIRTPGGLEKWIRAREVPVRDESGKIVRIAGIGEDITERKRYESELIQAREQAEAATRAKSIFLATMSHELRTPLNAVLGFTEFMEVDMGDRGVHDWDEDLHKIQRAGNHLLAIINGVLDFSKIEADKIELEPESVAIATLIEDITASNEPLASKNHVELQARCEPATLYIDRVRLGQCLFNLVGNACKFTRGGRVLVEGFSERDSDREWYTVRVVDTGIGIRPEDLDKLFTDFTQLDGSNTRKYDGTGLGLAISRRLARLMGGDITAESEAGKGSTFILRVPPGREAYGADTCS